MILEEIVLHQNKVAQDMYLKGVVKMGNKLDLAAIRARCDAATPGSWEYEEEDGEWEINNGTTGEIIPIKRNDAIFIAHARQDIPALLDEIDRLTRERNALRCCGNCDHYKHMYRRCESESQTVGEVERRQPVDYCDLWILSQEIGGAE
jgi:hypothetical protein